MKKSEFTTWEAFWSSEYGQLIKEHAHLAGAQLDGRDSKKKREEVYRKMMGHKREWDPPASEGPSPSQEAP